MNNNFSNFVEQIYSHLPIQNALHNLQERLGMNINILLFCCWFAQQGCRNLTKKDLQHINQAISPWHNQIIIGLRKMRNDVNKFQYKNIGEMIFNVELSANQMEQKMLAEIMFRFPVSRTPTQKIADACKSISTYCKELQIGIDQQDADTIKQLLMHIFPDSDYSHLATYWGNSSANKRHQAFSYLQLPLEEFL